MFRQLIDKIRMILSPFILRRLKEEVSHELPPKTTEIIMCDPTPSQRTYYDDLIKQSQLLYKEKSEIQTSKKKSEEEELMSSTSEESLKMIQLLTEMRKVSFFVTLLDQ